MSLGDSGKASVLSKHRTGTGTSPQLEGAGPDCGSALLSLTAHQGPCWPTGAPFLGRALQSDLTPASAHMFKGDTQKEAYTQEPRDF